MFRRSTSSAYEYFVLLCRGNYIAPGKMSYAYARFGIPALENELGVCFEVHGDHYLEMTRTKTIYFCRLYIKTGPVRHSGQKEIHCRCRATVVRLCTSSAVLPEATGSPRVSDLIRHISRLSHTHLPPARSCLHPLGVCHARPVAHVCVVDEHSLSLLPDSHGLQVDRLLSVFVVVAVAISVC